MDDYGTVVGRIGLAFEMDAGIASLATISRGEAPNDVATVTA